MLPKAKIFAVPDALLQFPKENKEAKSRSVREFDENLTVDMFGYSSVEEYYNQASPASKLDTVKVPLLCFVAADDPFVPLSIENIRVPGSSSEEEDAITGTSVLFA
ncbi:unnamed protein product [Dibothriocephalus latus]|uniref:Uncharacterized protein n=1 Tax=Dibothriocephalus latus TaxID=60516 RepID=A0A3P7P9G5_DIBLA|nr:unnamed protein product [Dibothriocephalus latus]